LILLDFVAANICVYFQYLFMHFVCTNIFGAIVLKLRFKIDVVVMIIWSIVIIINSVLTLQVSTASLPHDREPCEIKVVSNHTCSLHTCVCAGSVGCAYAYTVTRRSAEFRHPARMTQDSSCYIGENDCFIWAGNLHPQVPKFSVITGNFRRFLLWKKEEDAWWDRTQYLWITIPVLYP
jgi:hypothetical protein